MQYTVVNHRKRGSVFMPDDSLAVTERTPRVFSAEFWRFAFTIIVTLYHLEIFYPRKLMPSGTTAVEFFFVLAGFTIAMSAARRIEAGGARELDSRQAHALALDYLKKKLKAVYPLLAITLVLAIVVFPMAGPTFPVVPSYMRPGFWEQLLEKLGVLLSSEWEWLLMVGTPMGFNNTTASSAPIVPLWFLTQLIVVGYMYTFLVNRKYDLMMFAAPLIAVFGYTYFVLNSENILDFYVKMGLFNAGTVRAIAMMAMGLSIYQLYAFLKSRDWSLLRRILLQILEIFAIYRYCALTFNAQVGIDNFRRIPYILIIVLLSFLNVTFLSRLLDRKFMERLGKLSLPMYLIHFPVATVYFLGVYTLRRNPFWYKLPVFLQRSGGMSQMGQPIPLSLGDIAMYLPLVIIASLLLHFIVVGIKACSSRLRSKSARRLATTGDESGRGDL